LHQYLWLHPEIAMSRTKELRFFADRPELDSGPPLCDPVERSLVLGIRRGAWRRGIDWYRSQFDPSAPVRGESSPIYTHPWFGYCAERIKTVVPDPKLILCVRDPVDRAISQYRHAHALGNDPRPVDEALLPTGLYALTSRYADRLEPYLARFPEDRILIVESEALESRRQEALREVFRFLEVDDGLWSSEFEKRWNESWRHQGRRWRIIYRLRSLPGWSYIASLPPRRSLWLIERLTAPSAPSPAPLPEPSEAVRERLAAALADDAARLRQLTGRAFASWSV
jgi:hypothetical protein